MKIYRKKKKIIMPVPDHIADFLRRYKEEHHLSIAELSEELGIVKSATADYLSGRCNPLLQKLISLEAARSSLDKSL